MILLLSVLASAAGERSKLRDAAIASTTIATWISLGITEGQKWGEDHSFLAHEDYHAYRAVTNAGLIAVPLLSLGLEPDRRSIRLLLASNILGWGLYELSMAAASGRDPLAPKPRFHILGRSFPYPNPASCAALGASLSLGITLVL